MWIITRLLLFAVLCLIRGSEGNDPGCPTVDPNQVCVQFSEECDSNADCGQGELCCLHPNCGRTCEDNTMPTGTKPGKCPIVDPTLICTQEIRPGDCDGDDSCSGKKKCCRVGCRHRCVNPSKKA